MTTGGFDFVTFRGDAHFPRCSLVHALTATNPDTIRYFGRRTSTVARWSWVATHPIGADRLVQYDLQLHRQPCAGGPNGGVIQFDTAAATTTQTITNVAFGNEFVIGGHTFAAGDTATPFDTAGNAR